MVFYLFLAAFFSINMFVFYQTLNYDMPKYTYPMSLLRGAGLSHRPAPEPWMETREFELQYNSEDGAYSYTDQIDHLLKPYLKRNSNITYRDCDWTEEPDYSSVLPPCWVDWSTLDSTCDPNDHWGYRSSSPCIVLKLNKMIDFMPYPIKQDYMDILPVGLQDYINNITSEGSVMDIMEKHVWVWCESDRKEVVLEQSSPGIPLVYFPFMRQQGYLSPLSIIRVHNVTEKVEVTCKVYAENIPWSLNKRFVGKAVFRIQDMKPAA